MPLRKITLDWQPDRFSIISLILTHREGYSHRNISYRINNIMLIIITFRALIVVVLVVSSSDGLSLLPTLMRYSDIEDLFVTSVYKL